MAKNKMAVNWAVLLEFVMKILAMFMDKTQADKVRKALTAVALEKEEDPAEDKEEATRDILQAAFDNTPRRRPFLRSYLRFLIDEVPPVANMDKPKLPAASVSEAKKLAARLD